ncbi:polysaccharide deacetylase family protein [Actinomycetospora endophytica]|uniref:Polysaccharide deacetylase family protein n=1 Tax=Actinomycetospora endophytica TaxID=2291215 RepID=A0ABS8PD56_9PSEU|nr:polysaccharide deacetylase family protein [Actinomycetospora endophytica]MCD2194934.1 polysaccharide deacetylase family protein [Actinomycetospora endophytica]
MSRWAGLWAVVGLVVGVASVVLLDRGPATTLAAGPVVVVPVDAAAAAPARPRPSGGLLSVARPGGKVVALTFDDGPAADTPRILDVLARNDVTATFCEIGQQARARPDLVRRVVAAGHRLCNHTITHDPAIGTRTPAVMDTQLRASRDMLVSASGGADVDYFRAPEGRWTPTLLSRSAQAGMQPLGWTVDTRDWTRPGTAAIVASVERGVRPGAIILFHDGGGPRGQTVQALQQLIPRLRAQGYSFVFPS